MKGIKIEVSGVLIVKDESKIKNAVNKIENPHEQRSPQ